MKRTSQRSTDFIISFSNNSLHKFFLFFVCFISRKTWNWSWIDLDNLLWREISQSRASASSLGSPVGWNLICLFFLFCFCSWLFFCVWAISYKNTKGIWRRPREISFVKNNHLLLVMEGDNRQKKISQKEKLQHRKRRKNHENEIEM